MSDRHHRDIGERAKDADVVAVAEDGVASEATAEPSAPAKAEKATRSRSREEQREAERERLLAALASGTTRHLQERVAWILSTQPRTRDSDKLLQEAYWKEFERDTFESYLEDPAANYRKLTPLTSIARARAKIQNQYRLFQASPEVRKRRGQMSEEERERHAADMPPSPVVTVFADESGKTDNHLVVGSVWFLDPSDTLHLRTRIESWRKSANFHEEFHFAEITPHTLPRYQELIELVIAETPLMSFKHIAVPRSGIRSPEAAFEWLFYELVRQGIQHEDATGRAPLPRSLIVWKDEEAEGRGRDLITMAKLRDMLSTASAAYFDGGLSVEMCEPLNSKSQPLLQLADLYTGSINRTLSRTRTTHRPKDVFADYLLQRVRGPVGTEGPERIEVAQEGDVEVQLRV